MSWGPIGWWLEALRAGVLTPQPDEDPREDRPGPPPPADLDDSEKESEPWSLRSVGAWCGWGSFGKNSTMERDLKFAKKLGLGRLDVIVNDHSASRKERRFDTYNKSRITAFCRRAVDEGFAVHLMTWWMPHRNYIREGADRLCLLASDCGAQTVQLDAEEPWTWARNPMAWDEAAELTATEFGDMPFGVTGIGYTPSKKVGPLVERAHYMVPQCYSTSRNELDPARACPHLASRWRRKFGERELVVGLAGYRQNGRAGYTKDRFMTAAFHAAESTKPTDIVYWSLRHIRGSRSTANIIRALAQRARVSAGQ